MLVLSTRKAVSHMKIGLQLYTLRKVMETEEQMAVTLARVKEIGYECVQLAGTLEQMERVGWHPSAGGVRRHQILCGGAG